MGRSAMESIVTSPCALGGGITSSNNEPYNGWGTISGFSTTWAALEVEAIPKRSRSIHSGFLTAVTSSSHSHRGGLIFGRRFLITLKRKMKKVQKNQGKNQINRRRRSPAKIVGRETILFDST